MPHGPLVEVALHHAPVRPAADKRRAGAKGVAAGAKRVRADPERVHREGLGEQAGREDDVAVVTGLLVGRAHRREGRHVGRARRERHLYGAVVDAAAAVLDVVNVI